MARINTNIASMTAQMNLSRANKSLSSTLQRLSTGLRINRGADDPAGLIASEALRSEMASIEKAIGNSQRASNVIATAEGALSEVASLLVNIKELAVEAANTGAMSQTEIEANQLQIDSAIDSITRIANATTFAGLHLLNGNLGYVTSGVATSAIKGMDVYSVMMGDQNYLAVQVSGISSAEKAVLQYRSSCVDPTGAVTIEVASKRGVEVFNFKSGYSIEGIYTAINAVTAATGVSASWISAGTHSSGINFQSVDYGSDAYVSVRMLNTTGGTFGVTDTSGNSVQRDEGADIVAAINGTRAVGVGRVLTLNTTALDLKMTMDAAFGSASTSTFAITGGGAMFQLGPHINSSEQTSIGINSIAASRLGSSENGFLSEVSTGGSFSLVNGEYNQAVKIIEEAIEQISVMRGRLGAFEKNTLDTNLNSLQVTLENITASESTIRDADFAAETAALTRSQILVNAGTSVLAIANQTPQSVLSLLQ